jgi:hypothetical protein
MSLTRQADARILFHLEDVEKSIRKAGLIFCLLLLSIPVWEESVRCYFGGSYVFELDLSLSSYIGIRVKRGSDSVSKVHCHIRKGCMRSSFFTVVVGCRYASACAVWEEEYVRQLPYCELFTCGSCLVRSGNIFSVKSGCRYCLVGKVEGDRCWEHQPSSYRYHLFIFERKRVHYSRAKT